MPICSLHAGVSGLSRPESPLSGKQPVTLHHQSMCQYLVSILCTTTKLKVTYHANLSSLCQSAVFLPVISFAVNPRSLSWWVCSFEESRVFDDAVPGVGGLAAVRCGPEAGFPDAWCSDMPSHAACVSVRSCLAAIRLREGGAARPLVGAVPSSAGRRSAREIFRHGRPGRARRAPPCNMPPDR